MGVNLGQSLVSKPASGVGRAYGFGSRVGSSKGLGCRRGRCRARGIGARRADVNGAETEDELEGLRHRIQRGTPYGSDVWVSKTVGQLGLQLAFCRCGRPRKFS
jgi:hypothetical protein